MNAVDVVLQDEVGRLMDRLAATVPSGSLTTTSARNPMLRARLDDVEISLATARAALLEDYGRWRRVLDELEPLGAGGLRVRPGRRAGPVRHGAGRVAVRSCR